LPLHDIRRLSRATYRLGESPVWDVAGGRLLWCDILGQKILALNPATGDCQAWSFPSAVGSFGLADSGRLVVALRKAVHLFDPASGALELLAEIEPDKPMTRCNDGKVGPDGAFWVGTMDDRPERAAIAALYRVTAAGAVERKIEGLRVSNGLAWGPDARTLFHADSRGPWIDRWDFDADSGALSGRRRLAAPDDSLGRPDGGATDVEGCYWSCGLSAGRLDRFAPDGRLLESLAVPVTAPTMPCFGGTDGKTLFFTSLREGVSADRLAEFPDSGAVFTARAEVAGVAAHKFRDLAA